ncbi:MAG: hypothetical protein QCI00_09085, partial [Candidatus Thermoplasmatota archaeon]|nr:hypothetical protein [Candidatus Thermoplasmatota archaeon]
MSFDVIIDGANISHVTSTKIVAARIENAINELSKFGLEGHAIVPGYMYDGKNQNKRFIDLEVVDRLISCEKLSLVNGNDDAILISSAYDVDSLILSNDSFNDHRSKHWCTSDVINFIDKRRITFSIVKDLFVIPLEDRCKIAVYQSEKKKEADNEIDLATFKELVIKDPASFDIKTDYLPAPVNKLIEILNEKKKHRLSEVSSKVKKETGYSIKDMFGNSTRASQFLKEH